MASRKVGHGPTRINTEYFFLLFRVLPCLSVSLLLLACGPARPTARPDGVILQDDFSNVESGWDRHTATDITTDYQDGHYRIAIEPPGLDAWGLAGFDLNDMQIEVEARYAKGPLDNAFGVMCRYTRSGDENNFYFFLISSDGYYAAGKVVENERTFLNPAQDFEPLAVIHSDPGAANHLQATCQGNRLSFSVNGTPVTTFEDAELTHGDVGLIAGTFNEGGVTIHFDNAIVKQP